MPILAFKYFSNTFTLVFRIANRPKLANCHNITCHFRV